MSKYAARHLALSLEGDEVGQITAMGEVGSSRGLIDASVYGDDWADFVTDLQEGEEVDITVAYDPVDADHIALLAAYDAGDPVDWQMDHDPADFHVEFPGLITKATRGGERGDLLVMNLTVKILSPGVSDVSS